MASKDGNRPATISLSYAHRDALKRLAAIVAPRVGHVTYGEAIAEAERIVSIALSDPEMRERVSA